MHSENWDDVRYVLAVAREGSVAAAARALGVNHATVLRRVAAFEERHGLSVFEKDARGYSVPPDRLRLIEAARAADEAMQAVARAASGSRSNSGGPVRVTTTDTLATTVLPGILARISERPDAPEFEVLTSNRHLDFARLHADITLRPAERLPDDLSGERVATLAFAVYEAPGAKDKWLRLGGMLSATAPARWMTANVSDTDVGAVADSFVTLARLAVAGLGRAILPCILGERTPGLVRVDAGLPEIGVPVWVAAHVDLAASPRLKRLRAAIAEGMAEAEAEMQGLSPRVGVR